MDTDIDSLFAYYSNYFIFNESDKEITQEIITIHKTRYRVIHGYAELNSTSLRVKFFNKINSNIYYLPC
jgi:hypothetical protein